MDVSMTTVFCAKKVTQMVLFPLVKHMAFVVLELKGIWFYTSV